MTTTEKKKPGRVAGEPSIMVRISESTMPILISHRHTMELAENRRVTDREALDDLLKMVHASFKVATEG